MGKKNTKTNACRMLEQAGVAFETLHYTLPEGVAFSGEAASRSLGLAPECTFKTLCTYGRDGRIFVFVVPVDTILDLKKAAIAAAEKKVELVHVKDLRGLTGYERGAVSPVGMKKTYATFIDETALLYDKIAVSGGAKGCSVLVEPNTLASAIGAGFADIV